MPPVVPGARPAFPRRVTIRQKLTGLGAAEAANSAQGIATDISDVARAAGSTREGAQATLGSASALSTMAGELKGLLAQFSY